MRIFNLYQSGILISKFHFDNSFKYLEELDFFNLSFKEKREINKEDIKRYIFLYYMDLELADKILNIKDNRGRTALTYANQRGHKNIVKILKDAGAK